VIQKKQLERLHAYETIMKTTLALFLLVALTVAGHASPQEVAKALFPKTVLLTMQDSSGRPVALGSGFVLKKGYVVSNHHVIEGSASGFAKRVGDKAKYKIRGVVAKDEARDLVILAVDEFAEDDVTLSKTGSVEVGDTVYAIGNPRDLEGTFSQGIVSSLREFTEFSLLQITAPISPGSSGGPIANDKAEVVGVAVATFRGGQNLNFAIPAKFVTALENQIGEPRPLSQESGKPRQKTLFDSLESGKSTEGLSSGSFLWDGSSPDATLGSNGRFTISLKNNLDTAVANPMVLVLFHDRSGDVVDYALVTFRGTIPAKLGKRASGSVDPSTKQLTTAISRNNQFMYSATPNTKIEFRTLSFSLSDE
jgi:hypothetical protein